MMADDENISESDDFEYFEEEEEEDDDEYEYDEDFGEEEHRIPQQSIAHSNANAIRLGLARLFEGQLEAGHQEALLRTLMGEVTGMGARVLREVEDDSQDEDEAEGMVG
jgi:hypothetical protein